MSGLPVGRWMPLLWRRPVSARCRAGRYMVSTVSAVPAEDQSGLAFVERVFRADEAVALRDPDRRQILGRDDRDDLRRAQHGVRPIQSGAHPFGGEALAVH